MRHVLGKAARFYHGMVVDGLRNCMVSKGCSWGKGKPGLAFHKRELDFHAYADSRGSTQHPI